MAFIAVAHRPALITAGLLTALAIAPWQHGVGTAARMHAAVLELEHGDALTDLQPLTIDIPNAPSSAFPNTFDAWGFPDMRPWPHGMVIHPRPTDDYMVLRRTGAVYSLVSGLLAGLLGADA